MTTKHFQLAGQFLINKYRTRAATAGYSAAAGQLRKQGFPLEQALLILLGRVS